MLKSVVCRSQLKDDVGQELSQGTNPLGLLRLRGGGTLLKLVRQRLRVVPPALEHEVRQRKAALTEETQRPSRPQGGGVVCKVPDAQRLQERPKGNIKRAAPPGVSSFGLAPRKQSSSSESASESSTMAAWVAPALARAGAHDAQDRARCAKAACHLRFKALSSAGRSRPWKPATSSAPTRLHLQSKAAQTKARRIT